MIPIEGQSPPPIIVPLQEGAGGFMDWSPEEHASRPRSSRPNGQIPRNTTNREHSSSHHEQRGKGRPRYRSPLVGEYGGYDHLAVDVGSQETPTTLESSIVVFSDETSVQEALDGVLTLKEQKQFARTIGLDGNSGEVNRGDLKAIARLNQHALERIGFGGLGNDLRDTHLLEEARSAAKELVNSMSTLGDAGNGQVEEAVSRILDGLKATHSDAWQLVGTGAALAGFALLKKRGKQGLAYLLLTSGLAFCGGGSTANNPEGAEALDSFVQTNTFGIQGTFLDNALVTAPDFGKLYGVGTDVAPNYTTLTTTLLDKLRSDYPALSPTTLSYVNLNNGQSGRALEFAIVGTNQTAATGEPLFVAAYLDGGNVRINTVVQKKNDRYQVTYSDGSTREEAVTSYRLVEAINDKRELVLGDPLEVIIERDGVPYVIIFDPAGDGDAFIFIPAADQDQTVLIGSAGHFGPHLAALKPVAGIPPTEVAPLELPATATIGPTEELASATPLPPSETPEPSATPPPALENNCHDENRASAMFQRFAAELPEYQAMLDKIDSSKNKFYSFGGPDGQLGDLWHAREAIFIGAEKVDLQGRTVAGLSAGPDSYAYCAYFLTPDKPNQSLPVFTSVRINGKDISDLVVGPSDAGHWATGPEVESVLSNDKRGKNFQLEIWAYISQAQLEKWSDERAKLLGQPFIGKIDAEILDALLYQDASLHKLLELMTDDDLGIPLSRIQPLP